MAMIGTAAAATAAATLAGTAYLNARLSVEHDLLFFSIFASAALGLVKAVRSSKVNVFYLLEARAQDKKSANRPFVKFEGRTWTYAAFYDRVLRYGHHLRTCHGVRPRDVVALDMTNSDSFVLLWFALWSIGATPAFINYNLAGKPLAHCLRTSTARLALVDPAIAEETITDEIRAEFPGMQFVVVTDALEAEMAATEAVRHPDSDRTVDRYVGLAILIYTSGTTGLPKPAIMSWGKIFVAATMAVKGMQLREDDIFYLSMPLYHSSASCIGFCGALFAGATASIGRKFSTKTFWSEIRAHDATAFMYVGETCRYLTVAPSETDPVTGLSLDRAHRVRVVMGNGLRPDVWDRFKDRFGIDTIFEFYAATEGAMGAWNRSRNSLSKGAIGRYGLLSRLFVEHRSALVVLDPATDEPWRDPVTQLCRRARTGETGEMLARLPPEDIESRFQGYFGNSAATQSKILRDVFAKGDAWFRSGDVMRWEGTGDGRLFFSDRLGDTFRWKSENVSTAEVAGALGTHPAVLEANVYGVLLPNHDGRAGCAAVAFDGGDKLIGEQVLASVARHALAELPRYAVPLFLRVVRDVGVQTTGTNKQQKHVLREQGVDPDRVEGDPLFWLKDGCYVPFGPKEWRDLQSGLVKL